MMILRKLSIFSLGLGLALTACDRNNFTTQKEFIDPSEFVQEQNTPTIEPELINKLIKEIDAKNSGFKTMSLSGKISVQGTTVGNNIPSGTYLYAKNFKDYQSYLLNATSSSEVWAITAKRKNKVTTAISNPEKLPLNKTFKYLNSSFNFDEIFVFFFSSKPSSFSASIVETVDKENFFGNPLDNVKCCYKNRDLGAYSSSGEHLGQDLIGIPGDNVYAIADGTVKKVKTPNSQGYASVVVIEHHLPDDTVITSIYGHLSAKRKLKVKAGDKVKKGQLLGYIGDDDENGDGLPHLHLGVKLGSWDITYPGYCGSGINKIFSGSDYSGACSSTSGRFVRPLTFMDAVNKTGKNPYKNHSVFGG